MTILSILLDVAPATTGNTSSWSSILMMVAIFAIFYFLLIRPQQKRQKEIRKFRAELKVGDKVVTSGGIFGKIREIKDDSFIIEIAENVRVKIDKNSVFGSPENAQQK